MSHQPKHMLADRQLVDLVLGGDMHTFSSLVGNTEGLVAQIVCKLIPNEEDRKDIAQDIYLKVYQHLATFKFQSKLSTWIGQIAYNTCLTRLQRRLHPVYELRERVIDETERTGDETDRVLLQKELKGLLQTAIRRLPPLYQTLVGLYHQEELPYLEIAAITGLPEGTVKSYLFRARRQLKETMLSIYKQENL